MTELLYPESPRVSGPLWSPERRGEPSRRRRPSLHIAERAVSHPFISSHPTSSSLQAFLDDEERNGEKVESASDSKGKGKDEGDQAADVLRQALRWALGRADVELVTWLCGLTGRWREALDVEVDRLEDEEGWGVVGLAVHGSCGHREKEAIVRNVVARWGLHAGPRDGIDKSGWTPLHLAAIISTPPLISFLLTRGASTSAETDRGLTPFDLVAGMPGREEMALLLEDLSGTMGMGDNGGLGVTDPARRRALAAYRARTIKRRADGETYDKEDRELADRERWLRSQSQTLEVDVDLLLPRRDRRHKSSDLGLDEDEEQDEALSPPDGYFNDMLVFAPWTVDTIYDIFITDYSVRAHPVQDRGLPANAIYRYAKFALVHWDVDCLEWLVLGAVERIEKEIFPADQDLAHLAFWVYNTTLLLHLLRSDEAMCDACEHLGIFGTIEELLNATHVFIIRMTERRIDSLLDPALLDHETLDEVSDVRFEGEWNLFGRPLTLKKKRDTAAPRAASIFVNGNGGTENGSSPSAASLFGSIRDGSPFKTPSRPQSMQDIKSKTPRLGAADTPSTPLACDNAIQPSRITDILSSVLLVLQIYEINPAMIVQAFSQVFFWIACELFNRILTRKKYLCRSKAVQICMNITVLDDWVRANGLPVKTSTRHFEPLSQLLQWLQCLSQISDFDTLIVTMQNMRSINPLQLRRAVKDYKYEVGEGRMTDECAQYLNQVQKDWEKRRAEIGRERMRQASSASQVDAEASSVDALFNGTTHLAEWTPESPPECLGLSRPASRASYSSTRPLVFRLPEPYTVRRLPADFFSWLKEQEAEHRLKRNSPKHKPLVPARDPPLTPNGPERVAQAIAIPSSTSFADSPGVDAEAPRSVVQSNPIIASGFPSPGLTTSTSMDELRVKARSQVHSADFKPVPTPSHQRSESYELKVRSSQVRPIVDTKQPESPTPSRMAAVSPLLSPDSSVSAGRRRWWQRPGGEAARREGSEDTVMEDLGTPLDRTPGATKEGNFWGS